jgi:4-hydroxybenzoate polyprenyltransferase
VVFLRDLIALMRPAQWTKNAFVLAPLIFSGRLIDPAAFVNAILAVAVFCAAASASYLVNDIVDRERDRKHPLKRDRALASGRVDVGSAAALSLALAVAALLGAAALGGRFAVVVAAFFILQVAYSLVLKRVVVVDVLAIATGFVLRAVAGVVAVGASMSVWLLGCTFLLATFLALAKRRHEVVLMAATAGDHRQVLAVYGERWLDHLMRAAAMATVVVYILYALSPSVADKLGTTHLWVTIPFVVFGVFRYLFLVYGRNDGGNPTDVLLGDLPLQAGIVSWLLAVFFLLYR